MSSNVLMLWVDQSDVLSVITIDLEGRTALSVLFFSS